MLPGATSARGKTGHQEWEGQRDICLNGDVVRTSGDLPQLCASSSVEPEAPPKCGTSVTICNAYRWPAIPGL